MDDAGGQLVRLFCDEASPSPATFVAARRSFADPVLRDDDRVLRSLLLAEDGHLPTSTGHLAYSQGDLQPPMRTVVVTWMLEVTEEQKCEEEVFPLSVNYLDQVVSVLKIRKSCLQLVACACMFVASKFRETNQLGAKILVLYTDCSITVDQLLEWELVLLEALKWNVSRITPHDVLDNIIVRLPFNDEQRLAVRRHAVTFIVLCITELKFTATPSSMLAAACIITAANGLLGSSKTRDLRLVDRLHRITAIETDCLRHCHELIEATVRDSVCCSNLSNEASSSGDNQYNDDDDDADDEDRQSKAAAVLPSTPTDVRDISLVSAEHQSSTGHL